MSDIYYTFDKIEEKERLFNFVLSVRSTGKTIAFKNRAVSRFLETGGRFVYIRRKAVELDNKKMEQFFDKMQVECGYHRDCELKYEKALFYCNGEIMGYAVCLSTSQNERSFDFINVSDIYFEEFVIKEDKNNQYLKDEVFTFLELYSTICRYKDVPVWFLGNKIKEFNPYFLFFDLKPPKTGVKVWKDIAIEVWNEVSVIQRKKETRFGKLVENTPYYGYSIENIAYENNITYVRKIPRRSTLLFVLLYCNKRYPVYYCMDESIQISNTIPSKETYDIYCLEKSEKQPNIAPVSLIKNEWQGQIVYRAIRKNSIFYDNSKCEEIANKLTKLIYFNY